MTGPTRKGVKFNISFPVRKSVILLKDFQKIEFGQKSFCGRRKSASLVQGWIPIENFEENSIQRSMKSISEISVVQTTILKAPLRGQNLKISDIAVKYIKNGVFVVAIFVFEVILTVTSTDYGPQRTRTRKFQNYLPLLQIYR